MPDALPSSGDTDWYAYAQSVHQDILDLQAVPPGETLGTGVVQLDSFAGANDDAKLTAALTYAAAQTRRPYIMFPARSSTFSTGGRVPYDGMKFLAPYAAGPKNLEIASGAPVNHRVTLNVGTGTSAWFNAAGDDFADIYVGDLAFQSSNAVSQFWHTGTTGNVYPSQFHGLTFYGFKHIMGSTANKCLLTQTRFTGHWTVLAPQDIQFNIGGSDNQFWMEGYINIGGNPSLDLNGIPLIAFDSLFQTQIGYIYLTVHGDSGGMRLSGSGSFNNHFYHGVYEGPVAGPYASRPVITCSGGNWTFWGGSANYASATFSGNGLIEQTGGTLSFNEFGYKRVGNPANPALVTFPFLYQTAGIANFNKCYAKETGELLRVRWSDGVTTTLPAITNQAH